MLEVIYGNQVDDGHDIYESAQCSDIFEAATLVVTVGPDFWEVYQGSKRSHHFEECVKIMERKMREGLREIKQKDRE